MLGLKNKISLKSNVLQCCVNMNWCGRDLILAAQSTVELPSLLCGIKKKLHLSRPCIAVILKSLPVNVETDFMKQDKKQRPMVSEASLQDKV